MVNQAFYLLKSAMTSLPVLAVPEFLKTIAETDATTKGVGAVLLQDGRPSAFLSQPLSERAQMKSVHEQELLDIVSTVQN